MNAKALKLFNSLPCKDDIIEIKIKQNYFSFILPNIIDELALDILININTIIDRNKDEIIFNFKEEILSVRIDFNSFKD